MAGFRAVFALLIGLAAGVVSAAERHRSAHDMILVDEGKQQIHRVNLRDPSKGWDVPHP